MATKMTVVELLIENYATHSFDEKEAKRFAGEVASEVNGQNEEGFSALVKTAKLTAKGITLTANSLKIKKEAMTPRIIAFSAIVTCAAMSRDGGLKIRADIKATCEKIRADWEERDKAKAAREAQTQTQSSAPAPAPAPASVEAAPVPA